MKARELNVKEKTVSRLRLLALLLDSITYLKYKHHLDPMFINMKKELCKLTGHSTRIRNNTLIGVIGQVYKDNGLQAEFKRILKKFKVTIKTKS